MLVSVARRQGPSQPRASWPPERGGPRRRSCCATSTAARCRLDAYRGRTVDRQLLGDLVRAVRGRDAVAARACATSCAGAGVEVIGVNFQENAARIQPVRRALRARRSRSCATTTAALRTAWGVTRLSDHLRGRPRQPRRASSSSARSTGTRRPSSRAFAPRGSPARRRPVAVRRCPMDPTRSFIARRRACRSPPPADRRTLPRTPRRARSPRRPARWRTFEVVTRARGRRTPAGARRRGCRCPSSTPTGSSRRTARWTRQRQRCGARRPTRRTARRWCTRTWARREGAAGSR